MAITGGIKFFEKSQNLFADGTLISASTGLGQYCLDRNRNTYWRSVSSNDTIVEILEITFPASKTITRLFFVDIDWKQFTCKYDVAGLYTDFTNVIGIDGTLGSISETAFADNTAYYEFDSITTQKIYITITKTQTPNQEKYANQVIATSELGTFVGYPEIKDIEIDKNSIVKKIQTGRYYIHKLDETASFDVTFKDYPSALVYNVDMDLSLSLNDRTDPFLVWLCGGRRGTNYFTYTNRGWRLQDVYYMQTTKPVKMGYTKNLYKGGISAQFTLEESI